MSASNYQSCSYNGYWGCGLCCPPPAEHRTPTQIVNDRENCGRNGCRGCGYCRVPATPTRSHDQR